MRLLERNLTRPRSSSLPHGDVSSRSELWPMPSFREVLGYDEAIAS